METEALFPVAMYIIFGFVLTALLNESTAFDGPPVWAQVIIRILFIIFWFPLVAIVFAIWIILVPINILLGN